MQMSERGKELLSQWEGIETKVYRDVAGLPTIGVGHLLTKDELTSGKIVINGQQVKYEDGLTHAQIIALLGQDLATFEKAVNDSVQVTLQQHQYDALVSFAFNVGASAFRSSTLLKRLNEGKYDDVPDQLKRWVFSGGQKVQGLINRRNHEIQLWNGE